MNIASVKTSYFEPWLQFNHPMVRQLAFTIASPNLLCQLPQSLSIRHSFQLHSDQTWKQHFQNYLPRLHQLDETPEPLLQFMSRLKSTRLGLRFENLLWFWLQEDQYHSYQLLGHSIQKIEGARTLGELDFLILNKETQQVEHWEVALKYYLGEGQLNLEQWIGLNREDTLSKKLYHFTDKQFQFSEALDFKVQQRFAVLKGQLYLPLNLGQKQPIPNWVNLTRRLGYWGTTIPDSKFYRLERHEWLCPNRQASSNAAYWWTDGLYCNNNEDTQFYMFRRPPLLSLALVNNEKMPLYK
ncbi:DUF1853 family protein [Acinetobacter nosocomialis]|uniref:DUF1853 family protein n=1 Tax=Acinetobacter nosocomialis TaxID=106654 RepID=UPI0003B2A9F9|nr:DUF1853 family protein [Acinetobacter nosocomialis]MDH2635853.1 DUF1853 family protein [Acinetobacter nosocomialis]OTT94500.1 hypothetical protein CAT69_07850 [Acinetobacter nosocomialis]QCP64691.1 DUF1853 family protein [Acinetobacter nosocomialis M2]